LTNQPNPEDSEVYAVLQAYVDESRTNEKVPVIAVGGGVGTGLQWTNLGKAWQKALKTEPSVDIFHTCEFETPPGRRGTVYENWPQPRLNSFQNAIIGAIKEGHLEVSMVASIPVSEFDRVKPARRLTAKKEGKYGDAYFFCAFMLIEQIAIWAGKTYGRDQRVTYYFEQGGPHQSTLERAYAAIADDEQVKKYYKFWLTPTFGPKDSHPMLQVADKLVYEAAKHASHYFDDDPPEKHSAFRSDERRMIWHDRYPTRELILSGLDVHARWYDAQELARFYRTHGIKVTIERSDDFIGKLIRKAKRREKREAKRQEIT
jgi:hypothetical protein